MKITFWGAARNVTGSKHLIQTEGFNLLLDCGLYQGKRIKANELNRQLPFDAKDIGAVILSHAHADHCGMLPVLVKNGFKGKIYCTGATADIARYILEDSAGVQAADADYLNKHLAPGQEPFLPNYTREEARAATGYFEKVDYARRSNSWHEMNSRIRFKMYDAGHILGSAVVVLEIKECGVTKRLAFTGDLGRACLPILRAPEFIEEEVPNLIMECTYGGLSHRPIDLAANDLKEIVNLAIKEKKKIIIPAFALGRTQEIVYILHRMINQKEIPAIRVYIDSPLGEKITAVFPKYQEDFDKEYWQDFGNGGKLFFSSKDIIHADTPKKSKSINSKHGPLIVISGSGMAEGGRILHHLKNNIIDANNILLIIGYMAEDTLGRKIRDGAKMIPIYGNMYEVNAQVITLNEFSAHAGQNDLLSYACQTNGLNRLFLVHNELPQALIFSQLVKEKIPGVSVEIPATGDSVEI